MLDFFGGWGRRRTTYKKLPRIVRFVLTGLGFMLGIAGIIAMFTPLAVLEIGSIFVFTSLTILSFEFDWAYGLLLWLRKKMADKKVRKKLTIFALLIVGTYVTVVVVLFLDTIAKTP